jgi:hypothetical protein
MQKISIPYVEGDNKGLLTAAIIQKVAATGFFQPVSAQQSLVLRVAIVEDEQDYLGFRFDREPVSGKRLTNLIPTESRRTISASVILLNSATEEILFGPQIISANLDFDYVDGNSIRDLTFFNNRGEREKVIQFSLGQLDSIEGAQDDVLNPLFEILAKKIANRLLLQNYYTETN